MPLGRRASVPVPESYRGYRLIRTHGRVFAIPPTIDADRVEAEGRLFTHPAVLTAATVDAIRERIDRNDPNAAAPEVLTRGDGYDVVRSRGAYHAVPHSAGALDLDIPDDRARAGVISGRSPEEVEAALQRIGKGEPVEFAGWLPIFSFSGNCGTHPQFSHAADPPPGYRFVRSGPPAEPRPAKGPGLVRRLRDKVSAVAATFMGLVRIPIALVRPERGVSLTARVRVFIAMVRLLVLLLRAGCRPVHVLRFLQSRHLRSQLLLGERRGLVFLTSIPYTYGQSPWVIEIEDPTTLFYPMIRNGNTSDLAVAETPYFPIVKALLEADHCKAILTHMRSTAELVTKLFGSDIIAKKVVYAPIGVKLPAKWQRHDPQPAEEPLHLLFINSWCQVPENFYVRGGLDLLEAFAILHEKYPHLRLTMRTALPALDDHYHRIIERGWVRVINRFTTAEEMADLHANSHVFLLPAARIHIVSLLQAMSYGLAVVGSDGWGIEEYLADNRNGLVVRGRYGKVSWADSEAGVLREDYEPIYTSDPIVVAGLVEAISRLVEEDGLRRRLGRQARADVESTFNLANWNRGMKAAFDLARGVPADAEVIECRAQPDARRAGSVSDRSNVNRCTGPGQEVERGPQA